MLRCGAGAGLAPSLQGASGGTGGSQAVAAFVALVRACLGLGWVCTKLARVAFGVDGGQGALQVPALHSKTSDDTIAGTSAVWRPLASSGGRRRRRRPSRAPLVFLAGGTVLLAAHTAVLVAIEASVLPTCSWMV